VFVEIEGDDADIYARFKEEMSQPYDTIGAVLSVTPLRWYRSDVWFCSGIVAFMLRWPHHWKYTPGRAFDRMIAMGGKVIPAPLITP
jgi:hypothetical protein